MLSHLLQRKCNSLSEMSKLTQFRLHLIFSKFIQIGVFPTSLVNRQQMKADGENLFYSRNVRRVMSTWPLKNRVLQFQNANSKTNRVEIPREVKMTRTMFRWAAPTKPVDQCNAIQWWTIQPIPVWQRQCVGLNMLLFLVILWELILQTKWLVGRAIKLLSFWPNLASTNYC